jgi:hypothetical protein
MMSPINKVLGLMALALDKQTGTEESRTAAITALTLIRKHRLLIGPAEEVVIESKPPESSVSEPPVMSIKDVRTLAEDKACKTVSELVRKSILGEFPWVNATTLTENAMREGIIRREHWEVFRDHIRRVLNSKVNRGVLVSRSGFRGGYQLVQNRKSV